jgi:hypothetical protein
MFQLIKRTNKNEKILCAAKLSIHPLQFGSKYMAKSNQFVGLKNNKNRILAILYCLCISIFIIFVVFLLSNKLNHSPNGFIRLIPPHLARPKTFYDIRYSNFYIAGATSRTIYLANWSAPTYLLSIDCVLKDTHYIHLILKDKIISTKGTLRITVDSPHIYMTDGNLDVILYGTTSKLIMKPLRDSGANFISFVPLSPSSYIIKAFNETLHQNVVARKTLNPPKTVYASNVLDTNHMGVFATDGSLNYNRKSGLLVYVYFYKNQFICLDTNLTVLYKGETIDTIKHPKIREAKIESDQIVTLSSPPGLVNKYSSINSDWIFVNSLLRANNEENQLFGRSSVIDVYSLHNGKYKFSFYIPDHNGTKITNFRVFDKKLVALYNHYVGLFDLNF